MFTDLQFVFTTVVSHTETEVGNVSHEMLHFYIKLLEILEDQ